METGAWGSWALLKMKNVNTHLHLFCICCVSFQCSFPWTLVCKSRQYVFCLQNYVPIAMISHTWSNLTQLWRVFVYSTKAFLFANLTQGIGTCTILLIYFDYHTYSVRLICRVCGRMFSKNRQKFYEIYTIRVTLMWHHYRPWIEDAKMTYRPNCIEQIFHILPFGWLKFICSNCAQKNKGRSKIRGLVT